MRKTWQATRPALLLRTAITVTGIAAVCISGVAGSAHLVYAQESGRRIIQAEIITESPKQVVSSTWLDSQDKSGSSAESEKAVALALSWLAEHQFPNGGWSFDHNLGPCQGRCSNPGKPLANAVNGATSLALLSLIDHGNTHQSGQYKQNVAAGLQFLISRMQKDGSYWEADATFYSQALAILAYCEDLRVTAETSDVRTETNKSPSTIAEKADGKRSSRAGVMYAKSNPVSKTSGSKIIGLTVQQKKELQKRESLDMLLQLAASKSLAYALACQDRRHGGWRYFANVAESDISVTGWHVMAFHSATAINMPIPARTSAGVAAFLDSVQGEKGAVYGYQYSAAEATPARSAIGLLCRVYTGWDRKRLQRGVENVSAVGPSEDDMYYNYYATLLLHHYGGPLWDDWNRKLRDYLIRTQSHSGHETGSWSFARNQSNMMGGRHYDTCMACLILETYYRSKPVYASTQAIRAKYQQ